MLQSVLTVILAALLLGPLAVLLLLWLSERRRPRTLCLMYHRFCDPQRYSELAGTERLFTLRVDRFEQQVAHLEQAGYVFLRPGDVAAIADGQKTAPPKSVLLTIDDGCQSAHDLALPVLQKHGAVATVFVTTDPAAYVFAGADNCDPRMSDEQLRAIDATIQCEAHGVTHRPLSGLSEAEIRQELGGAKTELERVLGRPIKYLAIPGNWFDRRVMELAREEGYEAVWCSNPGAVFAGANRYALRRINIEGTFTHEQFVATLTPFGVAQRRFLSGIKRLPGRLLGPRVWGRLRKVMLAMIPGHHISARRMVGALGVMAVIVVVAIIWLLASWNR